LFYLLFVPKPTPENQRLAVPTSVDSGADGLLAAWRWLQAEHIPVVSLRYRYDALAADPRVGAAAVGNLLLISMPLRLVVTESEWQQLDHWIERGNTLLIMAALDDTPPWAAATTSALLPDLQRATRMTYSAAAPRAAAAPAAPAAPATPGAALRRLLADESIAVEPRGEHPLLGGVRQVQAFSELPASHWLAHSMDASLPLAIAQRADDHQPVLWIKRWGSGQLLVCALATPFSNRELDQGDNARLLSNIIAWARAPAARVIFDDAHQGLVAFYDPQAFFRDPRLHRTLWWLLFLYLAFVLGPLRLRNAGSPWQPVDETGLIDASGRFFSATVTRQEAALRLCENFFNHLRRQLGLAHNGEPLWDWLASQARISAAQRTELQRLFARLHAGERVSLLRVHNLLGELRREIA